MVYVHGECYEVIEDVKGGWVEDEFKSRYCGILKKYDYVVGDWGHNQLRLRGFFNNGHRKSSFDTKIKTLPDYLYEYCNFGCAYFVVKKVRTNKERTP